VDKPTRAMPIECAQSSSSGKTSKPQRCWLPLPALLADRGTSHGVSLVGMVHVEIVLTTSPSVVGTHGYAGMWRLHDRRVSFCFMRSRSR
jgi:hypothetical protein